MVTSTNNKDYFWGYGYPIGQSGSSAKWTVKKKDASDNFSKYVWRSDDSVLTSLTYMYVHVIGFIAKAELMR